MFSRFLWGPLIAKRDPTTGRVVKLDKTVAAKGERVPVQEQFLVPDKKRLGKTWRAFVRHLEGLGYNVDSQKIISADQGAATTRNRLYLVARRDDEPIVWPDALHTQKPVQGKLRWKPAADCIDWNIPCPSIFGRKKQLASATLRRIARGIQRHVIESGDPFIVPIAHYNGTHQVHDINEPLRTIVAATKGGEFALAAPVLAKLRGDSIGTAITDPVPTITSGGNAKRPAGAPHALGLVSPIMVQAGHGEGKPGRAQRWGNGYSDIQSPVRTIVASGGGQSLATAYMMQANGGFNVTPGHDLKRPLSTITNTGSQQQLITANMITLRQHSVGGKIEEPLPTITASGQHHGVVSAVLASYYTDKSDRCRSPKDPAATITTENRIGVVAASMVTTGYGEREGQAPRALDISQPLGTVVAGGGKHAVVQSSLECILSPEDEARAIAVAYFLFTFAEYPGNWDDLTHEERLSLVTVNIGGVLLVIVDIGLRMMVPRELYTAQGFPKNYIIDRGAGGIIFSKSTQVRLVGNSVSPVVPARLASLNCLDMVVHAGLTVETWPRAG